MDSIMLGNSYKENLDSCIFIFFYFLPFINL